LTVRVSGRLAELENVDLSKVLEKKCRFCGHLVVCAVYRAVKPLMDNWEKDRPLEVDDLAKICNRFSLVTKSLRDEL